MEIQLAVETDNPQLCVQLIGDPIERNKELELPEGVRLRFKGVQESSRRGATTTELILFALNVPFDVASSVIASAVIRYVTNRQAQGHIRLKLKGKGPNEIHIEADLQSQKADAIAEMAEKLQKLVED